MAQHWVAHDRLNETAHRHVIALNLALGDRVAALRAYDACRAVLDAELGIAPDPATAALAGRARATVAAHATPPPAARAASPLLALSVAPLVGRSREFGALVAAYDAASRGQTTAITLEGEPGIGKTRLAHDFLAWAVAHGATTLVAPAFETGGRLPYQPFVVALRRRNALSPLEACLDRASLAELGRLLPELRDHLPQLAPTSGDEATAQARLFDAVVALGAALVPAGPLVLHLDDLQWADAATLDLVAYLARRWSECGLAVLLLLGLRSEALSFADGSRPALGEWLAALARTTSLARVPLGTLSLAATTQLVATLADTATANLDQGERFSTWLFAETGGQPFYLLELLKMLHTRGLLAVRPRALGGWAFAPVFTPDEAAIGRGMVPPGVRELIQGQLQRLAPPAFALVVAGAVCGHDFDFAQLCVVGNQDEDTALIALDQVLALRLMRESDAHDGRYTFVHDRIRDVAYTEAGEARRRVFHRRALTLLQERDAPAAELARHARAAGLPLPTIRFTIAAGHAALRLFAVRDAIAHYTVARQDLDTLGLNTLELAEREALALQSARAHELVGEMDRAQAIYEDLIAQARQAGALATEWAALQRLLPQLALSGQSDLHDVIARTVGARQQAAVQGAGELLAEMEWTLAQLAFYDIDPPTAIAHAERAIALARAEDRRELLARSLNVMLHASVMAGRSRQGLVYAEEARALFTVLGDRAMEADTLGAISTGHLHLGEPQAAVTAARRSHAISCEIANPWGEVWGAAHLARALLECGEYGEAYARATEALSVAREHDHPLMIAFAATVAGATRRACFALDEAVACHHEAAQADARLATRPYQDVIRGELAADYALLGHWSAAHECARAALTARRHFFYTHSGLVRWHEIAALLRGGDASLVESDLQHFAAAIGDHRRHLLTLHRTRAIVAAWHDDPATALEELSAADALAAAIDLPGERWPILALLSAHHRQHGRIDAADMALAQSRAIVDQLAAALPPGPLRNTFLARASETLDHPLERAL